MAAFVPAAEAQSNPAVEPPVEIATIPADIAARLSAEQVEHLRGILAARHTPHAVDYRVTTSLFGKRFYVALFAGSETRSWERLKREKQPRPFSAVLRDACVVSFGVTLMLCMLAGVALLGVYLLQPLTGVGVFLG